jgi:hypothetical protein
MYHTALLLKAKLTEAPQSKYVQFMNTVSDIHTRSTAEACQVIKPYKIEELCCRAPTLPEAILLSHSIDLNTKQKHSR